ncbi:unnamed protein product [Cuscuta campestris]|uniref:TF-B3 domain-containing protein n=1 Tax=Cuscuta campestris TaxID=132261 RepID=A0A484NKC6_9ASTE|nr:unnamed protein product [Cuscuta campestris]
MGFLKEKGEEYDDDLHLLLGCNPAKKKRSFPTRMRPRCDINDGFLRPVFPIHQPQQTLTPFDWLLHAAEIALQEFENEKKKKKKSEIALEIHPDASTELNENKRKRKASSSASHPHTLLNKDNKNKRRKVTNNSASCCAAVELPPEFKHIVTKMGGKAEEAVLVIQKKLFQTDIEPNNGRFSIPSKQVANDFLTPEEKHTLHSGTKIENIQFIEPNCTSVCHITLRKWDMSANCIYNLTTNWKHVQRRNGLIKGDLVQLWAFRVLINS